MKLEFYNEPITMTLVSVIIPTHDRVTFVGGAIETVLSQTHDEVEVLVVNDGSTDGTREVLERYEDYDDRVRAFHRPTNRGIADGRNYALSRARGEYVCVLDDDDRWHPEKVAAQLAVMEALDEGWGVVYTGGLVRREDRVIGTYRPRNDRQGDVYPEILVEFGLQPYSSHMIRKECFERVGGYDPTLGCGEDWDHTIRLAREYKFAAVPDLLVERLFHEDNASHERQRTHGSPAGIPLRLEDGTGPYGQIWRKYRGEIERHPGIERQFRARRELACGQIELESGNRAKALRHGCRATARAPSVHAALVVLFACLGRRAFALARGLRDALADRRLNPGRRTLPLDVGGSLDADRDHDPDPEPDRRDRVADLGPLCPNSGANAGRLREIDDL